MIFKTTPKNFKSRFEIVSCFCECNDEILLLHRQNHKPEGDTWGVPAGKINKGETKTEAVEREIGEETGFCIPSGKINYFKKIYVKYPDYNFIYHIFRAKIDSRPSVRVNRGEHKNFIWVNPKEALAMNLIMDLDNCIKLFYGL